jgi:hypothetical protein
MMIDRIQRLQSLLERIKKNAALPKQPLGRNFVLGGTVGSQSDVSTGPSVPSVQPATAPSAQTDVAAQHSAFSPEESPTHVTVAAVSAQLPTATAMGRVRQRIPTQIGVAPAADEIVRQRDLARASAADRPPSPAPDVEAPPEQAFELRGKAPVQSPPVSSDPDIDNLSWSEPPVEELPPPDSSRRARVASSMDEALIDATSDSESQIPIKTPPPESGRQPAEGVYAAAIHVTSSEAASVPTAEQLGETLELEAPTAADIELDEVQVEVTETKEELEVELQSQPSVLELPSSEQPPGTAEAQSPHRAPEQSQIVETYEEADAADLASIDSMPPEETMLSSNAELLLQPQVTRQAATAKEATVEVLHAAPVFAPRSFLELLDASLQLGRD